MKATPVCSFPDCGRKSYGRKLCPGHVYQQRKGQELRPIKARRTGCSVADCDRPHQALGYCQLHRERMKRGGSPTSLLLIRDARERFDTFVEKTDTCWLWTGSLTYDGYGLFRENNRRTGAHRFAYEYLVGPIPEGLQLDHLCRVRNCVNPEHLEPVTPAENVRRAKAHNDYTNRLEERQSA